MSHLHGPALLEETPELARRVLVLPEFSSEADDHAAVRRRFNQSLFEDYSLDVLQVHTLLFQNGACNPKRHLLFAATGGIECSASPEPLQTLADRLLRA